MDSSYRGRRCFFFLSDDASRTVVILLIICYNCLLHLGEVKKINLTAPSENSVIIQDLLPNHSYLFKVKAQSQEGWGPEREGVITIESAVDPKSPLSPMPGAFFVSHLPTSNACLLSKHEMPVNLTHWALQMQTIQLQPPVNDLFSLAASFLSRLSVHTEHSQCTRTPGLHSAES